MNDKDLIQCLRCSGRSVGDKEVCGEAAERLAALSGAALTRHADDIAIYAFAAAMSTKMAEARAKGRSGWEECDPAKLSRMLLEHVEKGDPRDVANFCMMLWHHETPILAPRKEAKPVAADAVLKALGEMLTCFDDGVGQDWNEKVLDNARIVYHDARIAALSQEQAPADKDATKGCAA